MEALNMHANENTVPEIEKNTRTAWTITHVDVLDSTGRVLTRVAIGGADSTTITIGRGIDNQIVIDDPFAANRHLSVRRLPGGDVLVSDEGSKNKLRQSGSKGALDRIVLRSPDQITAGRTTLRFRGPGEALARRAYRSTGCDVVGFSVLVRLVDVQRHHVSPVNAQIGSHSGQRAE